MYIICCQDEYSMIQHPKFLSGIGSILIAYKEYDIYDPSIEWVPFGSLWDDE